MDKDNAQKTALWQKSVNVPDQLREPQKPSAAPASACSNFQLHKTIEDSLLRADAPEFVPATQRPICPTVNDVTYQFQNMHVEQPRPAKFTAQDRLTKHKAPSANQNAAQTTANSVSSNFESSNYMDMMRLRQIISSLILYPGQFDDLLLVFMETICPYFDNLFAVSEITQLIVQEAIDHPNFRYNGAKLCWHLEQMCAEFRAELHLRCKKQLDETRNLRNFTLFIAELYIQLPHDNLYGSLLIDAFKKLLSEPSDDNIKCVCQSLKLTGFSLDTNQKDLLDSLFLQLTILKGQLGGSCLSLVESVIALRASNWGRTASEGSASESGEYDPVYEDLVNEIVYEAEGHALTLEEQAFLMANVPHLDENPDDLYDSEMDEEAQADFEEFLQSCVNKQ